MEGLSEFTWKKIAKVVSYTVLHNVAKRSQDELQQNDDILKDAASSQQQSTTA